MRSRRTLVGRALTVVIVGVVLAVVVAGGGGASHTVTLVVGEASFFRDGSEVSTAGRPVGSVVATAITPDWRAKLTLGITDARAWPIPVGTRAIIRTGGPIAFNSRYVELVFPPHASHGFIPNGGQIPSSDVQQPVEVDQVLSTFDSTGRKELKQTLDVGGATLAPAAIPLRDALDVAPPAVVQARDLVASIDPETTELDELLRSTDDDVSAVQAAQPGLGQVITGAERTFTAIAGHDAALQQTLSALPPTLYAARVTLAHANRTLQAADPVVNELRPGVAELQRVIAPLNTALGDLVAIGPNAQATLADVRGATPSLNPLLARAGQLMPEIKSTATQLITQISCVRPYTPDIPGFAGGWGAFSADGDAQDKYLRVNPAVVPFNQTRDDPERVHELFPTLRYGFIRPPGMAAGQPWPQPACGITDAYLNPANDPEAGG